MRVLFVTHDYLPNHPAGTEIHTQELSRRLQEFGVEAELFTTEKDVSRRNLSLEVREQDGMRVHELVQNLFHDEFRETWDYPPAARAFGRVLDAFRPDVVHFMHLLYLSAGCVEEARRRRIPILFTLHDFWLTCARFGQLIHADGSICHTVEFARCGTCLAQLKWNQTRAEQRVSRLLTGVRAATGLDLKGPARRLAAHAAGSGPGAVDPELAARMEHEARVRTEELRRRVVPLVDRFLAPSRFLLERFVAWGVPRERIEHAPNGLELGAYAGFRREAATDGRLRVAFLGTLAPHKGPHVLLDAWAALDATLRARGVLTLYGPGRHFPAYVAELERRAREVGATLAGPLARADVPRAFAAIDLLVVPSTWYENMPLTLLEARVTRTPVLASDLGGMRELVEEGRHGWRFPSGDAQALARHLERVLRDPAALARLDFGDEPPVAMQDSARAMLARYERLRAERAGA